MRNVIKLGDDNMHMFRDDEENIVTQISDLVAETVALNMLT